MSFFNDTATTEIYTMEDFMEQTLVMKAVIAWGWLSVIVMVVSFVATLPELLGAGG
jgi:hypothetical protein